MTGSALCQGRVLHQLAFVHLVVVDGVDLEHALGQSTGLVKDHDLSL